jgi:hypothetical protein
MNILTTILMMIGGCIVTLFSFGGGINLLCSTDDYDLTIVKVLKSGAGMICCCIGLITIVVMLISGINLLSVYSNNI